MDLTVEMTRSSPAFSGRRDEEEGSGCARRPGSERASRTRFEDTSTRPAAASAGNVSESKPARTTSVRRREMKLPEGARKQELKR
jgi:hypothetical protein